MTLQEIIENVGAKFPLNIDEYCQGWNDALDEMEYKYAVELERIARWAEIGKAVEWAIENKFEWVRWYPYELNTIDVIDLDYLERMYRSQQPTSK